METIIFNVEGMSCGHCASSIKEALNELEGVCHSNVSLDDKTVEVKYDTSVIDVNKIKETIVETGYQVIA